jgi:type I restriction enzyme, S subunit
MDMNESLPKGWTSTELKNVVFYRKGKKPKNSLNKEKEGYIPYILIDEMEGKPIRTYTSDPSVPIALENDVLIVWDGSIGKTAKGLHGAIGSTIAALTPVLVPSSFLEFYLKTAKNQIEQSSRGTGLQHINPTIFWILPFPLPPLNEQKRIVAKLDQIIPRINSLQTRLDKIPSIIKRFRQSVLTSAVTGKLTESWREKHPEIESAEELLIKIKKEQVHKNNQRKKTKKYEQIESLYELPSTWIWTTFKDACDKIFDGTHCSPKNFITGEYMYITAKNIKENGIDLNGLTYVSKEDHKKIYERADVKYNDILYIKDGATTGIATINNFNEEFSILSSIGVFRVNKKYIDPSYVSLYLNSPLTKTRMLGLISGVAITRLTLVKLNFSFFAFPPIEEQKEIVRQVEKLFALADKLEEHYQQAKARIDKLSQSVLAKAFRGELVITEADLAEKEGREYESAEKLLVRIMEEKEKLAYNTKKTRKVRKVEH